MRNLPKRLSVMRIGSSGFWDRRLSLCKTPCAETFIGETETPPRTAIPLLGVSRTNNKRPPASSLIRNGHWPVAHDARPKAPPNPLRAKLRRGFLIARQVL